MGGFSVPSGSRLESAKGVYLINGQVENNARNCLVNVPKAFSSRYLNEGFSGGEKKRNEVFQMAVMNPMLGQCCSVNAAQAPEAEIVLNALSEIEVNKETILLQFYDPDFATTFQS